MQVLTTTGYKNIEDCVIGEQLVAYDINTGAQIVNELLSKEWFSPAMFEDLYSTPEQAKDEDGNLLYEQVVDENGDLVNGDPIMTTPELLKTKEQIFEETYGPLKFYKINNTYKVFANQSIWANLRVVHGSMLQVGDIIYDDQDADVAVTSVSEDVADGWWKMTVSGDHSYIADDLTLHNASRYWSGNVTSSSPNWNYTTGGTNWGSASGTADDSSVPTSADDVIFDGAGTNGNDNATISATITVKSLTITTGYTATMTHNAVLTIAGNWTYVNTYTIAGTSGITISATSTITSNGVTWPNGLTFSTTSTKTLSGDLTINGLMTISGATTLNKTTSETVTVAGGITVSANLGGTAKVILTGGTWSGSGANIQTDLDINGNVTISGTVLYMNKTLTYVSGVITTTGSKLQLNSACTLNTNGINWNEINFVAASTYTLTSNLTANGLVTWNASNINKTTSETMTVGGGITLNTNLNGTAKLIFTGGTWSGSGASIFTDLDVNGNVTISGTVNYLTGIMTYISGSVTTTSSTLSIQGSCTLNVNGINWNNINFNNGTVTLLSDFTINGLLKINIGTTKTINKSTSESIKLNGGVSLDDNLNGNANIYLKGGSWSASGGYYIYNNLFIEGNVLLTGNVYYINGTLTYLSGNVNSKNGTLNINGTTTLLNFHKCPLKAVVITAGQTVTMNRFFSGTPSQICQVSSTGANYTITFQDNFEKIGRHVAVSGCTLTRPMQLLLINNQRFNTNRNTNIGVRYVNQSPNGIALNAPSISDTMTTPALGLASDPNFIMQ